MFPSSVNRTNEHMELVREVIAATHCDKREGDKLYEDINAPPPKKTRPDNELTRLPAASASALAAPPNVPAVTEKEDDDWEMSERAQQVSSRKTEMSRNNGSIKLMDEIHGMINQIVGVYDQPTCTPEVRRLIDCFLSVRRPPVEKSDSLPGWELAIIEKTRAVIDSTGEALFPSSLNDEIVSLSDDTFELLLSTHAVKMGCGNLENLTINAAHKHSIGELVTQENRKFLSIIRHGLLPQFQLQSTDSRKLFPCYEKLVSVDEDMVIDHLLIPIIVNKGTSERMLCSKINASKLFKRLLEHLKAPLPPHITSTLVRLLEKETELSASVSATLFKLLRASCGYGMSETLAGFYHTIVKKFIHSMTEAELREMQSLNLFNQTVSREPIERMLEERTNVLKLSGPNDSQYSHPATYSSNFSISNYDPNDLPYFGMYPAVDPPDEGVEMDQE